MWQHRLFVWSLQKSTKKHVVSRWRSAPHWRLWPWLRFMSCRCLWYSRESTRCSILIGWSLINDDVSLIAGSSSTTCCSIESLTVDYTFFVIDHFLFHFFSIILWKQVHWVSQSMIFRWGYSVDLIVLQEWLLGKVIDVKGNGDDEWQR